jgi:serine/threonine protein kinase
MLAKSLDQVGQAVVTQRGEMVGDLFYLSPEQVMGGIAVDQRTDLYSLGAALYALLTGKPPFLGGPADVINKILNQPPEPPTKTHLTIPASFEGIVLRLLAKHADGRYANATLVVKELERTGRHAGLMK